MDLRKLLFLDNLFSPLSSKRRVVSGFAVGVLTSLLVVSLLVSLNTPSTTSSSSLFSWFFSAPDCVLDAELQNSTDLLRGKEGDVVTEKTHDGNSSKGSFREQYSNLRKAHGGNISGDTVEPSNLVKEEESSEKTHDGNSSKSYFSEEQPNMKETHVGISSGNNTKESSNLVKEDGSLKKTHDVESTGKDGNRSSLGKTGVVDKSHDGNISRSDERKSSGEEQVSGDVSKKDDRSGFFEKKGGIQEKNHVGNQSDREEKRISSSSSEARVTAKIHEAESKSNGSGSGKEKGELSKKCDIFAGRWVRDEGKPYYPAGSCPHIDDDFNCHKNGRLDEDFLRWRWQPYDCNIPSLNATDFLERLRGKRLLFVGDSLNRNMWESLVCILRHSVRQKSRVYEASGRNEFKTKGYYAFRFEDYNCSVDFVRSPFLVRESYIKSVKGLEDEKLRLDLLDATASAYHGADIIVFNTGHWWTHEKTSSGKNYYQEGDYVYPVLKVMEAYKKALTTWSRWVDKNIDARKTRIVFRGYSLTHFRGGQWNSGGQCHKEVEPIFNETFLAKYPSKMRALEQVLQQMKTPVIYLNISRLTDFRKDGHPSIYRKKYSTVEEQISAEKTQDCSHWCLPGIPDTWNALLYASLLMDGKGSWRR